MKPKLISIHLSLAVAAGLAVSAISGHAQSVVVTGSLTDVPGIGNVFDYTLTLHNTGLEAVDALWFGWIPGVFNVANPTAAGNSLGWSSSVVANSIQFGGNAGTAIAGLGGTGIFTFDSTSTPAQFMAGTSGESWAYGVNASPFGATPGPDNEQFTPTLSTTPEPSTFGLFTIGSVGLLGAFRRKLRGQ